MFKNSGTDLWKNVAEDSKIVSKYALADTLASH